VFTPRIAKAQRKTGAKSTNNLALHRSTLGAQFRLGAGDIATLLHGLGYGRSWSGWNGPGLNVHEQEACRLADQARIPFGEGTLQSWDLSKVSIFPPNRQPSFTRPRVQPKLVIGAVNDSLENEADQVIRTEEPELSITADLSSAPPNIEEVLNSPGERLDADVCNLMERRFGRDFSGVRVHTDSRAAKSAQAVDSLAYTFHHHIVFGAGQYAPKTATGARLLAHELTHTVQHGGSRAHLSAARLKLSRPADAAEREADNASNAISEARPVTATPRLTKPGGTISRQPAVAKTGLRSAVEKARTAISFRESYRFLNGLEIGDLLKKLTELKRLGYLDGLLENFELASGVNRERLFLAMKAVELQGKIVRDQFASLFKTQMEKIKEADQREKILSFVSPQATAERREEPAPTSSVGAKGAGGGRGAIPAEQLSAFGTEEQTAFKRQVYNAQMERAIRVKAFFPGLPEEEMEVVENGQKMRKDAAQACQKLLAQARADLKQQQDEGNELAQKVVSTGVGSAYRDPMTDFKIWDNLFQKYYKETQDKRAELDGGEHGDKAVQYLAGYIAQYKAVAGFSNHSSGIAVDFVTTEGKETLGADKSQNPRWKKSWLHKWLVEHAASFGFQPLATEAWHWDYRGTPDGPGRPDSD